MKNLCISFIAVLFVSYSISDECYKCVSREKCEVFANLNPQQQEAWLQKFQCTSPQDEEYSKIFGFTATAKEDYICCPNTQLYSQERQYSTLQPQSNFDNRRNPGLTYPNVPNENTFQVPQNNVNHIYFSTGIDNQNIDRTNPNFNTAPNIGNPVTQQPNQIQPINVVPGNNFPSINNPVTSAAYFSSGNDNLYNVPNSGGQCIITNLPPNPATGCCGREATDPDRIYVANTPRPRTAPPPKNPFAYPNWPWTPPRFPRLQTSLPLQRRARSPIKDNNVTIDERIAGGRETGFEQFPWTVLLRATFDYGNNQTSFECGGSLISSQYVLTAGHCVYNDDGPVIQVEVYLAEYDKTTFPRDCRILPGEGQLCLENIIMYADDVIIHPEYSDPQLRNDIALIRLRGNAPYTDYVRPICLPSIDINTPQFSNLRLAVAGWGRNGRFLTDIKQSTVVNLVTYQQCNLFYPFLTLQQLCAAGSSGEDTCKGDSGGPLMTVYEGKYEVVGVVSGKRADAPCGNGVPSLYTNVYHYLDWIRDNIKK